MNIGIKSVIICWIFWCSVDLLKLVLWEVWVFIILFVLISNVGIDFSVKEIIIEKI